MFGNGGVVLLNFFWRFRSIFEMILFLALGFSIGQYFGDDTRAQMYATFLIAFCFVVRLLVLFKEDRDHFFKNRDKNP